MPPVVRIPLSIAAVAATALALLLACTADDPSPTSTPDVVGVGATSAPATTDSGIVVETAETPAAGIADTPSGSGTLINDPSLPSIPDPLTYHSENGFLFGEVYSGLTSISGSTDGRAEPELAAAWSVSEGGMRYVFELREGLMFSDGTPVTAWDVKWSWERALLPEYRTDIGEDLFGEVVGARAMLDGDAETLEGLVVVDDRTLQVDLTRPIRHFLFLLAHPAASVLSQRNFERWGTHNWVAYQRNRTEQVGGFDFDELPVGTGPFRMTSYRYRTPTDRGYVLASEVALEPNPHYWRGPPELGALLISSLRARLGDDSRQALSLRNYDTYAASQRSVLSVAAGNPVTVNDERLDVFDALIADAAPVGTFLALNTAVAPFDDVHFRRALLHAADRSFSGEPLLPNLPRIPASGLLPPGMPGHVPSSVEPRPSRELAEASFAESRYATGLVAIPQLALYHDGNAVELEDLRHFGERWREWLKVPMDYPTFDPETGTVSLRRSDFTEPLEAGTLQMRYVDAPAAYPDPCAFLCQIPELFGPKAQTDETRQLRAMLDAAMVEPDRTSRIAKYQAIESHILDRALVIPAFWGDAKAYELVKQYISGYKVPAYGGSRYEDVVVDTTHPDYPVER